MSTAIGPDPATAFFGLPLAFDAEAGIRQGLQSGKRYRFFAFDAQSVGLVLEALERFLDLHELASLDFSHLAGDFFMGRIKCCIRKVT